MHRSRGCVCRARTVHIRFPGRSRCGNRPETGGNMALDTKNLAALAAEYANRDPQDILAVAIREYTPDIAISFSGAEDVVLVDMAAKAGGKFRVFSLDTGRLHPETYQFLDKVRDRYGIPVEVFCPKAEPLQKLVREKGLFSFYKDGH